MMGTITYDVMTDLAGLADLVGTQLGPTDWTEITQAQVDAFADLTGDHNFLHVDPAGAAETPFGGTIAHGFLSVSLLAPVAQLLQVADAATSVNYGLDRLRFPAPLPVGSRWRGVGHIAEAVSIEGGVQVKMVTKLEVQGSDRPAVVADLVVRFYA
jgi:acyl dehydratase